MGYGNTKLGKTSLAGIEVKNVGADFTALTGLSASPELREGRSRPGSAYFA